MSAGSRFLIILFSLSLIVLGLEPLKGHYNGVGLYVSQYAKEIFGHKIDFSVLKLPSQISIEVGKPNGETTAKRLERAQKELKEVEAFDRIKPEDRLALDKLLENLDK